MPTRTAPAKNRKASKKPKRPPFAAKSGEVAADVESKLSATIGVPVEVAYMFFRDFENLPLFMKDLKSVEVLSDTRSRWTVEVKGREAQWEAEIVDEIQGEMISWQSVEDSDVDTRGTIWFTPAPEDLGTIVSLALDYAIPGGKLAEVITKMTGEDPRSLALTNLRRLKCYLETGEVATIEGQPSGRDEDAEMIVKH